MFGSVQYRRDARFVDVGVLEQSQTDFGFENGEDRFVDLLGGDSFLLNFRRQILHVSAAGHVHIEPSGERLRGCVLTVAGIAVSDETVNGVGVADDETFEVPRVTQDVAKQPAITGGGDVVEIHVGAHEGRYAGIGGGFEGRQVGIPHLFFGDVGGIVVAAAVGGAVTGEVFGTGQDAIEISRLSSLET